MSQTPSLLSAKMLVGWILFGAPSSFTQEDIRVFSQAF